MRGVFEDQEQEPVELRRDAEFTLGSGTLLAIFVGLLFLCGLCFGLGYRVGHHGSSASPAAAPGPAAGSQPAESSSIAKPSAVPVVQTAPAEPVEAVDTLPAASEGGAPGEAAQTVAEPVQSAARSDQLQIHPALTPAVETNQTGQPGTAYVVRPAFAAAAQPIAASGPAGSLMVQIAAVSNPEDAGVLTDALRKRGYPVSTRREPADNLIHVRIGPFATPAEANNWKMKLLNDGYNAVVQ